MADCKTCVHNCYVNTSDQEWVCCAHPVTIAHTPKPQPGFPAWVNFMTSDALAKDMAHLDCPTYERAALPRKDSR